MNTAYYVSGRQVLVTIDQQTRISATAHDDNFTYSLARVNPDYRWIVVKRKVKRMRASV